MIHRGVIWGESRFRKLQKLLPRDEIILGVDEHTAIIIDLSSRNFTVEGKGVVTVLIGDREQHFFPGILYSLRSIRTGTMIKATDNSIRKEIEDTSFALPAKELLIHAVIDWQLSL